MYNKDIYSNKNSSNVNSVDLMDELIKKSLSSDEKPSLDLDNQLKSKLYKKNMILQREATRKISLWYIPMLLNSVIFLILGIMSVIFIGNITISLLTFCICLYLVAAGILLTFAAVRFADLKNTFVIETKKERRLS